jgi:hypothetical protein
MLDRADAGSWQIADGEVTCGRHVLRSTGLAQVTSASAIPSEIYVNRRQ